MHEQHSRHFVICVPDLILIRTSASRHDVRVRERVCARAGVIDRRVCRAADCRYTHSRRHANSRTAIPLMTELFCKLADHFDVTLRALACRQDGRKTETALEVDVLVAERVRMVEGIRWFRRLATGAYANVWIQDIIWIKESRR